MTVLEILDMIFIGPLKLCFEIIFSIANRMIGHPGLAIIVLSLVMNVLVLPLYKRADAMQEEARDIDAKLSKGVAHIKKTFSGDERMMILQTYYRQNNYRPTDALNGSVSLLLEIPFFMAAYQFLSNLEILNGVSLGPIQNLGAPDGLLVIGGITLNLLPILMTTVNVISSALYLKGFPLKTKVQLYGMALFFLVFLYTSPSCLVFYWTLNNVFSLVKTIFYKLKNPQRVLRLLLLIAGMGLFVFGAFYYDATLRRKLFVAGIGLLMQFPAWVAVLKTKVSLKILQVRSDYSRKNFVMCGIFLVVFIGLLIPSTYIAASPQEYVDVSYFYNPILYIVRSLCLAAGFFLVWMGVFCWLASPKGKVIFEKLLWALCGVVLVNYMFFGTNLGVISSNLQYEGGMHFTHWEQVINIAAVCLVAFGMYLLSCKWSKNIGMILLTAIIALGGMSVKNIATIHTAISKIEEIQMQASEIPSLNLSKTEKNVVVLMLDRAMGEYIPYLFNEKPELEEKYDGFTYYSNTISFGGYTNFGTPALMGGYEYTPVEMNKRASEPLVDKHNEALLLMPTLFAENGYDVTLCDPVYANYQWTPDLTMFDEYKNIDAYITQGKFSDPAIKAQTVANNRRNFFVFSVMKSMPLVLQYMIYNDGRYNQVDYGSQSVKYRNQEISSISTAEGMSAKFMNSYNVLASLPSITRSVDSDTGSFIFMTNDTTHEPMLLQKPEYVPTEFVDNTSYDRECADRFTVNGRTLEVNKEQQIIHYHTNMAAMLRIADWLDYLRKIDVYDNTRIILVSDHGRNLGQLEELIHGSGLMDVEYYFPLLMIKDFDSHGFTTSDTFMTNADVPVMAVEGLINNPVNPFTGKLLNSNGKTAHDQFVICSRAWNVAENNGNTFLPARWASVKDNIWDKDNWTFFDEEIVLTDHKFPN